MRKIRLDTKFASAERASEEEVQYQRDLLHDMPFCRETIEVIPDALMVLNSERQAVYANRLATKYFSESELDFDYGLRPGEIWGCEHSKCEGGCGTSEFCKTCGTVKAILNSQKGKKDVRECRLSRSNGEAIDLRVWATPFWIGDDAFTVLVVRDISDEKRRRVLERIFFHDINNVATGLQGFTYFFNEDCCTQDQLTELRGLVSSLTKELIEEIRSQQTLSAAENNELSVNPISISSKALLNQIVDIYVSQRVAGGRHIMIDEQSEDITFKTDKTILMRVLGNLVKNALEASDTGHTVTIGCRQRENKIEFCVHNPKPMPRKVQLQIFKRSFSTKGKGRGLGTYSIRLLTERYLKGKVTFNSSVDQGTVFMAYYPLTIDENKGNL